MSKRVELRDDHIYIIEGTEEEDLGHYTKVIFPDEMKIEGYAKRVKHMRLYLRSKVDRALYPMMLPELFDMLMRTEILMGRVSGIWGFCKHGKAFGLKYMGKGRGH